MHGLYGGIDELPLIAEGETLVAAGNVFGERTFAQWDAKNSSLLIDGLIGAAVVPEIQKIIRKLDVTGILVLKNSKPGLKNVIPQDSREIPGKNALNSRESSWILFLIDFLAKIQ